MPNSVPLRDITVTIVEPGTSRAASSASFAVGMPRLRKKCSLPPMNLSTAAMSDDGASTATIDGDSSRSAMSEPARLRLCPSSPICSIWASDRLDVERVVRSRPRTAAASTGPSTSRIQRSRSTHLVVEGAHPQHLAQALVEVAERLRRRGPGRTGTTSTSTGWSRRPSGRPCGGGGRGRASTPPEASIRSASSTSYAQPSNRQAPISAPRIGPEAVSQVSGGPECSRVRSASPITSRAGRTSTSSEPAASSRSTAVRLAAARRGSRASAVRSSGVAEARRPPVDVVHLGALGAQRVGEDVDARGDDRRAGAAAGRPGSSGRSQQVEGVPGGRGVGGEDGGAGGGQRVGLAATSPAGRPRCRPARRPPAGRRPGPRSAPARARRPGPGRRRTRGRRPAAARRARRRRPASRSPPAAASGRSSGARGRRSARRPRSRRPRARGRTGPCPRSSSGRSGVLDRTSPSAGAAISMASSASVPPE